MYAVKQEDDPEFQEKLAKYKTRVQKVVDEIKTRINKAIQPLPDAAYGSEINCALMEMGIDRYIDLHGTTDALELVTSCFKRRAELYRRSLQ